ncbi:hypothetical protein [Streptomyces europaeiscabiei]|uniref:hypothetical protein n=1 Tax=Streptomyces europaeiscabiei TaxID=146819 RepID=UPI000E696290|nr:hypothetical protein [Streptomyces europaeiscabiei]MDX2525881.1 hypothetical protein [Streptomyces europaeiscabiei]MDX2769510.1 hypothetical protein [Streptomyces europaeiscabiei]MDX3777159.1 hypothetical protein [Streptomyces europaeiscabiei]MDX3860581.1 hypothetical protein [Streptomyces europaeiscabiei]MDX3869284.1 hypothetical protein [Streptomyces europaeiscabiei]
MKFRYAMKGRMALSTVTIATGLVLTVAGCGGGGDDDKSSDTKSSSTPSKDNGDDDKQESEAPTAESVLAEVKAGGLTLKVTSAARDGGGFVTVEGTVTNGTGKPWVAADWRGDESELVKNGGSIAGANLVDQTGKKKYLVLRDTEGRCLCTRFTGGVGTGATTDWFAQFPAPPESTTSVDFQVGSMPPATIELSEDE